MRLPINALWYEQLWYELADRISVRFDISITAERLIHVLSKDWHYMAPAVNSASSNVGNGMTDDCVIALIKKRLIEHGLLNGTRPSDDDPRFVNRLVGAVLHVFDIHTTATEEQQARLTGDSTKINAQPAASKIFSTPLVPAPIDKVAKQVSGMITRKEEQPSTDLQEWLTDQ